MNERDYNVDDMEHRHSLKQHNYRLMEELRGDDTRKIQIQTLEQTVGLDELEPEDIGMSHNEILDKWCDLSDSSTEHINDEEYRVLIADKYRYTVNAKDLAHDIAFYDYSKKKAPKGSDNNKYNKLLRYLNLKLKVEQQKLVKTNYQIKRYESTHSL